MTRVFVTAPADADTAFIIGDLGAQAGALVANRYNAEFDALYRRLETFPESGSPRRKLGRFVRVGLVSPYVVFYGYIPDEDLVLIVRIIHGRRRITRRMLSQPSRTR